MREFHRALERAEKLICDKDAEIERLRAIEKAARTYYHNYCQDEANEEGVCGLAQQLDAIALRDALAVEQSRDDGQKI